MTAKGRIPNGHDMTCSAQDMVRNHVKIQRPKWEVMFIKINQLQKFMEDKKSVLMLNFVVLDFIFLEHSL